MFYFVKTPWLLRTIYPHGIWRLPANDNTVYLTFDDGPHPHITPFVLEQLDRVKAKATFFCIGKNVQAYPGVMHELMSRGHRVGNHTQQHLNGWKTDDDMYIDNIRQASKHIDTSLFRPPYGRIKKSQIRLLGKHFPACRIVFWDVLSGDFDTDINAEQCIHNVVKHTTPGSIIVFHDSEKAFPRLELALPVILDNLSAQGFRFDLIP